MTLLLPRAKSSHTLKLLLCALLACPPIVSTSEPDGPADAPASAVESGARAASSLHRPDRKSSHRPTAWTIVADETEGPAGLDDVGVAFPSSPDRPLDLPSLVPTPLDPRPPGRAAAIAPSHRSPPLRC